MRRSMRALLGALVVLAAVVPVTGAEEPEIVPLFRERQVYFRCEGGIEDKNQNRFESFDWTPAPPAANFVTDGAGCGYINSGAARNGPTFQGTVTGNLKTLTVVLHIFPTAVLQAVSGAVDLDIELGVGDETFTASLSDVPAVIESANYQTTQQVVFGVAGLDAYFATEDGFGTVVRNASLNVTVTGNDEVVDWVWDAGEVPAGIIFNPPGPSTPTVTVPPPPE